MPGGDDPSNPDYDKDILDGFSYFFRHKPSLQKGCHFFSRVDSDIQQELKSIFPIPEGHLPVIKLSIWVFPNIYHIEV